MTPETLAFIAGLIDRFGFPLSVLVALGWLLLTRRLTLGSETTYVEERRREERDGRLLAEAALRDMTTAMLKLAEAVEDSTEQLLDALNRGTTRGPRR